MLDRVAGSDADLGFSIPVPVAAPGSAMVMPTSCKIVRPDVAPVTESDARDAVIPHGESLTGRCGCRAPLWSPASVRGMASAVGATDVAALDGSLVC